MVGCGRNTVKPSPKIPSSQNDLTHSLKTFVLSKYTRVFKIKEIVHSEIIQKSVHGYLVSYFQILCLFYLGAQYKLLI